MTPTEHTRYSTTPFASPGAGEASSPAPTNNRRPAGFLPDAGPTTPGDRHAASGGLLDGVEALTNAAIGLLVSLLLTWLWLGFTPMQSAGITAVFFAVSTARSFAIRRFFRWVS